ncbi:hypothetical protein [Camelimonas lactis]|uniref:hypothetical protein n=1 Tax=Camelimonas lactis TaxID=659006 RepID=UPI0010517196|nr:hypothetical protein [Camelimonas lactis]
MARDRQDAPAPLLEHDRRAPRLPENAHGVGMWSEPLARRVARRFAGENAITAGKRQKNGSDHGRTPPPGAPEGPDAATFHARDRRVETGNWNIVAAWHVRLLFHANLTLAATLPTAARPRVSARPGRSRPGRLLSHAMKTISASKAANYRARRDICARQIIIILKRNFLSQVGHSEITCDNTV